MTTQQTIKLILILAFVGFSVISWIVKQLQEQRKKKEIRDRIERRELEILRTGRDVADQPPPAPDSVSARKRLEEIVRERAAETGLPRETSPPVGTPTPGQATERPIPTRQPRQPQADRTPQPNRQPQKARAQQVDRPLGERPQRPQRKQKQPRSTESAILPSTFVPPVVARSAAPKVLHEPQIGIVPGANISAWKRAIVLSELLGPPMSMRDRP
ncbi:MAG: hypothetical protein ACKVW3_07865 [Phycisphaerales bacterium]